MTKHLMDGWKGLYVLLSREKGGGKRLLREKTPQHGLKDEV